MPKEGEGTWTGPNAISGWLAGGMHPRMNDSSERALIILALTLRASEVCAAGRGAAGNGGVAEQGGEGKGDANEERACIFSDCP